MNLSYKMPIGLGGNGIWGGSEDASHPDYLHFTDVSGASNTLKLEKHGTPYAITLDYSLDDCATWTRWYSANGNLSVTIPAGGTCWIKGDNAGFSTASNYYWQFVISGNVECHGNVMSLLDSTCESVTITADYCFVQLFYGCASLITAPTLPATTLATNCYYRMFQECTALTSAPALPATTLATNCYYRMFRGCTALTSAPALPATTLATACYYHMFYGCAKLNSIVTHAEDISAANCIFLWLNNVKSTGDFYNLGGATYPSGASGIPTGWTEHTTL